MSNLVFVLHSKSVYNFENHFTKNIDRKVTFCLYDNQCGLSKLQ